MKIYQQNSSLSKHKIQIGRNLKLRCLLHSVRKPNFDKTPFKDYSKREYIFQGKPLLTDKSLILKSINRQYVLKTTTKETDVEGKAQQALQYTKQEVGPKTYRFDSVATTKKVQSMFSFSSKFAGIFAHTLKARVQLRP